jgi:hypothetical protein
VQHVTFTEPDADQRVEEWVFLDHGKETREAFTMKESALSVAHAHTFARNANVWGTRPHPLGESEALYGAA